jgi:hypothetical protein
MPLYTPTLSGNQLTVDMALKQPTIIRKRIAELADSQILIDKLFHMFGQPAVGHLLYNVLKATDYYLKRDVEQVAPGDEFPVVEGVEPETKIAYIEKWGGYFPVPDEKVRRNDEIYFDNQTTQLANTIAAKVDARAMDALTTALANGAQNIPGNSWADLVTIGDPTTLTPSSQLPTADFATVHMTNTLQELGIKADLLLLNPGQARDLRVAYADKLDAMLKSAGLEMFENPRIPDGEAYAVRRGQVGIVGFEKPLTVETWREPKNQTSYVLAYVMPLFAVDKPYAAKRLTGLNA